MSLLSSAAATVPMLGSIPRRPLPWHRVNHGDPAGSQTISSSCRSESRYGFCAVTIEASGLSRAHGSRSGIP